MYVFIGREKSEVCILKRPVADYHGKVLEKTLDHFKKEQKAGHEIHPARPASQTHGGECYALV